MIANQTKIKFNQTKDSFFTNETLEIIPNRFNILYGRNGSGKTLISQAIAKFKESSETEDLQMEFIESLTEEDKKHIFVYNEKFIEQNIKVDREGLNQIVMLGEQVELDQQIKECDERIERIRIEKTTLEEVLNKNIVGSVANRFYSVREKLIQKLASDGNWAERDGKIRGNKIKSKVVATTIDDIFTSGKGTISLLDLKKEVEQGIIKIRQTKGKQKIQWVCPRFSKPTDFKLLNNYLRKKIEMPKLTDRDKAILNIVEGKYGRYISNTKEVFSDETVNVCPLCLRPIDAKEKETTIQFVEKILNKEAQDYQDLLNGELSKLIKSQLSIIPSFEGSLFVEENKKAQTAIGIYNSVINEIIVIIKERLENIYQPFSKTIDEEKYNVALSELRSAFDSIDTVVKEYNRIIEGEGAFKNEILKKNKQLAFNEFESLINDFVALSKEKNQQTNDLKDKKEEEKQEITKRNDLVAQKQQVVIALKFINEALSYVFFDKNRLQLKKGDGCYTLFSRKKEVKPTKISVGERNVIALCYFFASMFVDKEEKDKYKDASLIIIDDPVSSFDFENRLGVVSLLRWMIDKFLKGNENTKILVMTHDLQTVFNLQKIRKEMDGEKDGFMELVNKSICHNKGLHNEYKILLCSVFDFACGNHDENASVVGNQMRKVMEAYSSFVYAKNFESISHDIEIINSIPKNKQLYYQNLMTRLVLNGESHKEEAANALELTGFKYTIEEKRLVAKSIIMFLYYINPKHVYSNLSNVAIEVLKRWESDGFDVLDG